MDAVQIRSLNNLLAYRHVCVADKLLVQQDAGLYFFINQGCLTVDNMNDQEEMEVVDVRNQISLQYRIVSWQGGRHSELFFSLLTIQYVYLLTIWHLFWPTLVWHKLRNKQR